MKPYYYFIFALLFLCSCATADNYESNLKEIKLQVNNGNLKQAISKTNETLRLIERKYGLDSDEYIMALVRCSQPFQNKHKDAYIAIMEGEHKRIQEYLKKQPKRIAIKSLEEFVKKWNNAKPSERIDFINQEKLSIHLQGKTKASIITLLGQPDFTSNEYESISYIIGKTFLDFNYLLHIDFDKNNQFLNLMIMD